MPNKYLDSVGLAEYTGLIKRDLAPKASPAFTGTPTAPTPTAGDDSTKIATTEFVQDAIDSEETRADGAYLPLTGGSVTGNLTVSGTITGDVTGDLTGNADSATNDANGNPIASTYLPLTGGSITGDINLTGDLNIANGMLLGSGSNNTSDLFFVGNSRSGYDGYTGLYGANSYYNGASIFMYGKNHEAAGRFDIHAFDGTNRKTLFGNANGSLTWDGHNIALAKDFLPLAGGTMTGTLVSTQAITVRQNADNASSQVYGGTDGTSAKLVLFGKANSVYPGAFSLEARNGSSSSVLYGACNGTLTWDGKEVERVNASGTYYIRYESGLQIVWGSTSATTAGTTVTFPVAFANTYYSVIPQTSGSSLTAGYSSKTTTSVLITSSHATVQAGVDYICIGKWK